MSASTIARWNAIPLERTEQPSLKRSRSDLDDDDISLASLSPQSMDVDNYDEYAKGTQREEITIETPIKSTNKGFTMLAKLGWSEGQPLGISGDGRVDPIPFQVKRDLTGLGKTNQDVRMIETTVSQRRGLDSERQQKETEEQRQAREDSVARRSAIASEVSSTLKAFYCTLCEKQFKTVAQYDEHTNSYAHHHKARFKDMQASQRALAGSQEEGEKRKEKERKREEKELRKIAKAAGVKMPKPPTAPIAVTVPCAATEQASGSKASSWSTLPSTESSSSVVAQKSGWATVSTVISPTPKVDNDYPLLSGGSPASPLSNSAPVPISPSTAPAFRNAGWTSLDTGSSHPLPPASSCFPAPASLPPTHPLQQQGPSHSGSWPTTSLPLPQTEGCDASHSHLGGAPNPPSFPPSGLQEHSVAQPRSGWQQFQRSGPRRR